MALFGRKQSNVASVPQEVREYYQSERRERAGVAWLLALGTLAVTLLLAVGLFFGGKWAYRAVTHGGDKGNEVAQTNQATNQEKTGTSSTSTTNTTKPEDNKNQQQTDTKKSDTSNSSATTSGNTTGTGANQSSQTPAASTPAAGQGGGSGTDTLVNTGPASTVVVFVSAMVGGVAVYQGWVRLKRSDSIR